jgi:hypothetical protein
MYRSLSLLTLGALSLGTTACKPEEAPAEISEPMIALFSGFDGDVETLRLATLALETALVDIDLTATSLDDRAFTVPALTADDLGGLTFPADADPEGQVPVAIAGQSANTVADSLALVGLDTQVCIESNTTVWYERAFDTDVACFTGGTSDTLETTNVVHKKSLVEFWYELFKSYRTFDLDDGRSVMIARSWTDQTWTGVQGANTLTLTYTLEVWLENAEDASKTDRFYAIWSAGDVGVSDGIFASLVKGGMDEGMQNADAYISGDTDCGVTPNEDDRPEGL